MASPATAQRVVGLVINPVAGVGGPAGLKGSDGSDVQAAAVARGSASRSAERALLALAAIAASSPGARLITAAGAMGEDAVRSAGLSPQVVHDGGQPSTGADTASAAAAIAAAGASLLLFVGGDGTARDVASGLPAGIAMLGVPAGVKMYSGCFAVSPSAAGALAARWIDSPVPVEDREVLDVDEEAIRTGRVDPRLFAIASVPFLQGRTQARKSSTPASEAAGVRLAAAGAIAVMDPSTRYLLGPGGTTMEIARQLGIRKTPLGVDVVRDGQIELADASERELLELLTDTQSPSQAMITVIGGQGFLLGRGNQQLSAAVVRSLGSDPLRVVATEQKLTALGGRPLLVDTGDRDLDRTLAGYTTVITGVGRASVYPVHAPENEGAQLCV
ncbi:ATP-NAD kinase family protein [Mycetocola sp.]|uniref:ATP-NAD kinase family protein n=1 Tax=Mycetocola sp. TaxID=1871042 RepID=UPI003988BE14